MQYAEGACVYCYVLHPRRRVSLQWIYFPAYSLEALNLYEETVQVTLMAERVTEVRKNTERDELPHDRITIGF